MLLVGNFVSSLMLGFLFVCWNRILGMLILMCSFERLCKCVIGVLVLMVEKFVIKCEVMIVLNGEDSCVLCRDCFVLWIVIFVSFVCVFVLFMDMWLIVLFCSCFRWVRVWLV